MSTAFVQNLPFPQYTSFSFLILGILLVALIVIVAILRMDREDIRSLRPCISLHPSHSSN